MNKNVWQIWLNKDVSHKHPTRPYLLVKENTDRTYQCLACDRNIPKNQKDGGIYTPAEFYRNNPKFDIIPYELKNQEGLKLQYPTFVNLGKIYNIDPNNMYEYFGTISKEDSDNIDNLIKNKVNESLLTEDKRSQLLNQSRNAANYKDQSKGRNRFARRVRSRVANSTKEFNSMNMNKLFKENILDVNIRVTGETDDYLVRISYGNFLAFIQQEMRKVNQELNVRIITRALVKAFNSDDVYIRCNCPDFRYRFAYWLSVRNVIIGDREDRPSDITNPNDDKGSGCKHILLVLSNNTWIMKVAAVIYNYINYMKVHRERLYADIIYPAIYDKKYEEPVQLELDMDDDELASTEQDIDTSNKWARTKGQFKKGNKSGIRFAPNKKEFDMDSLLDDEPEDKGVNIEPPEDEKHIEEPEEEPADEIEAEDEE